MTSVKRAILLSVLVSAIGSVPFMVAGTIQLGDLEIRRRPVSVLERSFYAYTPATMQWLDSLTISSVRAGYSYLTLSEPFQPESGDGFSGFTIGAQSYYKLSSTSTVWGSASYKSTQTRDVSRSNAIDYDLLAPYVLGDTVGGSITSQRYSFSGGWSLLYGRWSLGVDASYRAEVAYRSHDPRVHDIVSDLTLRASVGRRLTDRIVAGVGLGFRTYNQVSEVEFVNPMNDIQTYPFTGLGTYYNRFAGNSNKSAAHSLTAFSAVAQLISLTPTGPRIAARYTRSHAALRLRGYNNITLAFTDTDLLEFQAALGFALSPRWLVLPAVSGVYRSRSGVEQLFGSAIGSGYEKIGERPNYSSAATVVRASIPIQYSRGYTSLTFSPAFTRLSYSQSLREPQRKVEASLSVPSLNVTASTVRGNWLFRGDIEGCMFSRCKGVTVGVDLLRHLRLGALGVRLEYSRLTLHTLRNFNSSIYYQF